MKTMVLMTALFAVTAAAQAETMPATAPTAATVCPAGTHYAKIRHDSIKPGQWAVFESAVKMHNAWYRDHANASHTDLDRVIKKDGTAASLATDEAVTVTHYDPKPAPKDDAAHAAFVAEYGKSSTVTQEAAVCMPGVVK